MIYVGIDVSKSKHDCCVVNSDGEVLCEKLTVPNTQEGLQTLLFRVRGCMQNGEKVKIGLEATGHFSLNILRFLLDNGMPTCVLNPLHTNLFRKSRTLRKTKTDRVDAKTIAFMLLSEPDLRPYSTVSYHNEHLKSLSRFRYDMVSERSKFKRSVSRLITILFPELESLVPTLHMRCVYDLLTEYPSAGAIASAHLTRLTNILVAATNGRYDKDKAIQIREAARNSIGSQMPAKSMELQYTIQMIAAMTKIIQQVENEIKTIVDSIDPPLLSIPGIGYTAASMILSEIGDFSRFDSADKILAFAGMSPSTYQSGQLYNTSARMEKRGSIYLRTALFQAAQHICRYEPSFARYMDKKRSEGKHYYVAVSHVARKLVRVIYHLQITGERYVSQPAKMLSF